MSKAPVASRQPRPMTSAALGRWGETCFAAMCSAVGLIAHKPDYDVNGWDFLVEFPYTKTEANTDLVERPEPMQCFVQVKTIWEGGQGVDLRLSSAARLGKSPLPSFLCILEASETIEIRGLHIVHMWGQPLERVLRKLREMQAKGQSTLINKVDFRVPVPRAADRLQATGASLRCAMEKFVGDDYAGYIREKEVFLRTAGFPARPVTGTISFKAERPADYSDFLLGLKPLPVADFKADETRWGITLPLQLASQPVTVQAIPRPIDVEVMWRRAGALGAVRLQMRATHAPNSGEDGSAGRWLIVHPNLEIQIDGASCLLTVKGPDVVPTSYRTLVQLHALEELLASAEPVEVKMLVQGKLVLGWRPEGSLELRSREASKALGGILRELGVVLAAAGLHDIQAPSGSWQEWRKHLFGLCAMLERSNSVSGSAAIEVLENATFPAGERETLYVNALEFADCFLAYYATCRGRFKPESTPRRWRFHASDFVIRELRQVEKSDEAMHAFAKEAEATTGLATAVLMWGPSASESGGGPEATPLGSVESSPE